MRDIDDAGRRRAIAQAQLALEIFAYRITQVHRRLRRRASGGVDAVVFTAGIGENAAAVRARACTGLEMFGIHFDARRNGAASGETAEIQADNSAVKLLVVRTNEELEIAEQARALLATAGR
ncbi:MAG: hypothetical protein MZV65_18370 [Chromatiales bacterium]|nr:hypothetical protein [Chromatiales bacterium]